MKIIKRIPVSIRLFVACAAIFCPLFFLVRACFFAQDGQPAEIPVSGHTSISDPEPESSPAETGRKEQEGPSYSTDSEEAPIQTTEELFWQNPSTYLLDGQSLEQAVAQLGTTAFRVPFILREIPCEYMDYDYKSSIPETISPNQLHILTIRLNDSYFTLQLYSDTECPIKDASVTGVSESSDTENPDHLYLPSRISVGESADQLAGLGFTSSDPVFGGRKHYYTDTLGQKLIVHSKDGIIVSVGIYAEK